jgi:hypothetical protein
MRLHQLAKLVRSKNAGPFTLTIDVMFGDRSSYERVRDSGALAPDVVARLYNLPVEQVRVFTHDAALAVKISFPRTVVSGSRGDTDVYGGQFHSPLVDVEIP